MNKYLQNLTYISNNQQLSHLLELLTDVKIVALDTEFTRRTTYYPVLSLIQLAFKDKDGELKSFIIDCQYNLDLSGIFKIISDSSVTKILHSAAQDLQIFYHKSKILPQAIFDTQVMASICGYSFNCGYSKLVEELFLVTVDKKHQDSDWSRRPLSKSQIEYAALDVFYLEEAYNILQHKLLEKGRFFWVREEMDNVIKKALFKEDEALFKGFSFRGKTRHQIGQIKNLAVWREKWAQKIDIPRRHFLSDEEIEKIVVDHVYDLSLGVNILNEIDEVLQLPPHIHEISEDDMIVGEKQKTLFKKIKEFISSVAVSQKLQEQLLMTNFDIKKIIYQKSLFDKLLVGWRRQLFGDELRKIIESKA